MGVFSRDGDSGVSLSTSDSNSNGLIQRTTSPGSFGASLGGGSISFTSESLSGKPSGFESNAGKSFGVASPMFQSSPGDKSSTTGVDGEDGDDIYVEPIAKVTAVSTSSGEENEYCVFESRAKVYRYDDKKWKERGIGELKLLQHKQSLTSRIVMRREQIHKVCVNHTIALGTQLKKFPSNEQTMFWQALSDISDGEPKDCLFAARFKTMDLLNNFKQVFMKLADKEKVAPIATENQESGDKIEGGSTVLIGACDPKLAPAKLFGN